MAKVLVVYWPNADLTGPDLDLVGKVVDYPDEVAQRMVQDGCARWPSDQELAVAEQQSEPAPPPTEPAPVPATAGEAKGKPVPKPDTTTADQTADSSA